MKKKLSILLVLTLIIFAFVPALALAQEETEENQDTVAESEETFQNLEELLDYIELDEDLNNSEKIALERKLTSYDESLNIESMSSVVDKILNEEIDLGQGFVILRNLEESESNGLTEEEALAMINSYQDQENSGQMAFQTALELRKLSREDISGEYTDAFASDVADIIEENGEIETSELKQLAAEYRKDAREENREQMQADRSEKSNSASEKGLEKGKGNSNASENASNKGNNGKGNSNGSKSAGKSNGKGSNNSSNSSSNSNANK